ncbi:unnamed protein product [Adineta steineri]|uniref:G-protein coupled receptors family 1 profile domain-containing protein n=1 Tax=Adineta steineri TaxID=433720 RepID=A0A819QGG9_9BILA|nr:unnamed protein product [Adineta steineri]CAF1030518.1 unnamed protein product [Adineta steineri]CAF3965306.1 unnamed protein product [Adineta steineri]CAF4028198.1 unnamed protein product [Adineta steineri]
MSSNTTFINYINQLSSDLDRYLSIGILLFGTIGNILNCLALSQRPLRSNPCVLFFLASSIASIITLISGVLVRLLSDWSLSLDLTNTINWLCKVRVYVLFNSRTIASWLIMLATCDRWLSSSVHAHYRQMSTLKNAQRNIIVVIFLSSIAYVQLFYCYEANLTNSPLECYGRNAWCRLLIDLEFISIVVLIPSMMMLIFGILTILNIRKVTLRQIQPVIKTGINQTVSANGHSPKLKKSDRYLLLMLLIQVILLTLFSLPQAIQNLYSHITQYEIESSLNIAINNFIFNLFFLLTYVTNGMPFYIYTLCGGTIFRKALRDSIHKLYH